MHFAYMCVIIIIIILFVMHSVYMYNWKQIWAVYITRKWIACMLQMINQLEIMYIEIKSSDVNQLYYYR